MHNALKILLLTSAELFIIPADLEASEGKATLI